MRMTVGKKLFMGFGVVLALLFSLGYFAGERMEFTKKRVQAITEIWLPSIETLNEINFQAEHVLTMTYRHKDERDAVEMDTILFGITQLHNKVDSGLERYDATLRSDKERQELEELRVAWDEFKALNKQTVDASRNQNTEEAATLLNESITKFNALQVILNELKRLGKEGAHAAAEDVDDAYQGGVAFVYGLMAASLVIVVAVLWMLHRGIVAVLRRVTAYIVQVASGDLSIPPLKVRSKDELGDLAKAAADMVGNLRKTVSETADASMQVAAMSEELAAGAAQAAHSSRQAAASAQEMSSGSSEQLAGAVESSKAMEMMAAGIDKIAEASASVSSRTAETTSHAERGNTSLGQVVEQLGFIGTSAQSTAELIRHLGSRSEQIDEIVTLIAGITKQTSILALNASIEASRAGESGRGFAVVAEEVKKLASESRRSTEHIAELIHEIQADTRKADKAMTAVTKEVTEGVAIAAGTRNMFDRILSGMQTINEEAREVSETSAHMAASTEQITATLLSTAALARGSSANAQSVAHASEEQLASIEDISDSAAHLSGLSEKLQETIRIFRV